MDVSSPRSRKNSADRVLSPPSSSSSPTNGALQSVLANFLIERASKNSILGNYFHWYFFLVITYLELGT